MTKLEQLMKSNLSYNLEGKRAFRAEAMKWLRKLAKELELVPSDYDLRWNEGGVAASGDAILHTPRLYVNISKSSLGIDHPCYYRYCNGIEDYAGGRNHWASMALLTNPKLFAEECRRVMEGGY